MTNRQSTPPVCIPSNVAENHASLRCCLAQLVSVHKGVSLGVIRLNSLCSTQATELFETASLDACDQHEVSQTYIFKRAGRAGIGSLSGSEGVTGGRSGLGSGGGGLEGRDAGRGGLESGGEELAGRDGGRGGLGSGG